MKNNSEKRFFPLGAPIREKYRQPYREHFWNRYTDKELAIDFIYRVLDRQINKALGLLTYNALLFGALSFRVNQSRTAYSGRIIALGSCFPLLALIWVNWGSAKRFADAYSHFTSTFTTVVWRTYFLRYRFIFQVSRQVLP